MKRVCTFGGIAAAIVGLGASIASLVDYVASDPTFCADAGCGTVRASAWAHPLGVPMPVLGIAFFAAMLGLAFVARPRTRVALAIAGAAWAIALIVVQATVVGAWCKLCLVADPAAIVLGLCVVAGAGTVRPSWRALAIAPAVAAVVGGLALWTSAPPPPAPVAGVPGGVPAYVARAQQAGPTTIVEVVDFECPFCRRMQTRLAEAIAKAKRPVTIVRKMLPLAMHPHARAAALAWCCADAQGKGDAMAEVLFAAAPETLTPEGCEALAVQVGCDRERYRASMPAAEERVAADVAEVSAAGDRALPTMYIGNQRLVGARKTADELAAMIERL